MDEGAVNLRFFTRRKLLAFLCLTVLLCKVKAQSSSQFDDDSGDSDGDDNFVDDAYQHSLGDCSFETDECSYERHYSSRCSWYWNWDNTNLDHSYNDTDGSLLSLTEWPSVRGTHACTSSPQLPSTDGGWRCLTFWYQKTGNLAQSLRVVVSRDQTMTNETIVVWDLKQDQGKGWRFGRTSIYYGKSHYVVFEAIPSDDGGDNDEPQKGAIVALDDIIFTEGPCSVIPTEAYVQPNSTLPTEIPVTTAPPNPKDDLPDFNCTFVDESLCHWKRSKDSNMNWNFMRGRYDFFYSLPIHDRTGTNLGDYIYVDAKDIPGAQARARLESPPLQPATDYCLTFWYHMYGTNVDSLNVYFKKNDELGDPVWTRHKNQGSGWKKQLLNIKESIDNIVIVFEATVPKSGDGSIALDDLSVSKHACPDNWMICDFEQLEICNYVPSNGKWMYQSGVGVSTGPTTDHTFNSDYGHYVVVNGTSSEERGPYPLTTPTFTSNGYMCLRFWYFMTADTSTSLAVTLQGSKNDYIFHLFGKLEFEPQWRVAQKSFTSVSSTTQLVFTANTGTGSIVAIDDVRITNGFCSDEGDCNMENGDLCTWRNDPDDDFDWLIGQGRDEDDEDPGPLVDHTLQIQQGHYIYLDMEKQSPNSKARIYSKLYESHGDDVRCMHFWYSIQGSNTGSLAIYQYIGKKDNPKLLWAATQDQGQEWNYGKVPFSGEEGSHQVIIEGFVGEARRGIIALDDIVIADNDCLEEPRLAVPDFSTLPPPTTPKGWISLEDLLSCDFQEFTNYCHWNQTMIDEFDWSIGNLEGSTSPYIPPIKDPRDYIYVYSWMHQNASQKAILFSPLAQVTAESVYCVTFSYYMFGSDVGNLTLTLQYGKGGLDFDTEYFTYWTRVGTQEDRWLQAVTTLKLLREDNMRLRLEADRGFDGVIAVREFSVTEGECENSIPCHFDAELTCQWKLDDTFPLSWKVGNGIVTNHSGPAVDHTTLSEKGLYQFIQNQKTSGSAVGRFTSQPFNDLRGTHCFSFWYYMGLAGSGVLEVITELGVEHAESAPLWSKTGDESPRWHLGQVPLFMYKGFQIVLQATFDGKNNNSMIAIDDLKITPSECDQPASCTFDDGPCGYMNEVNDDDFNWLLGFGRTQDPESIAGPIVDASGKENGLYMYVDMTFPINMVNKSTALLRSDIFGNPIGGKCCLEFSYIKLGKDASDLKVYVNTLKSLQDSFKTVWLSPDETVTNWAQEVVSFNCSTDFEIVFEATQQRGSTHAFIGIDEVNVFNNPTCQEKHHNQTNPEASLYRCNFEAGSPCSWTVNETDQIIWEIEQGDGSGYIAKPHFDHTMQTYKGHYLYMTPDYVSRERSAQVTSPEITVTGTLCFKFWYQMFGGNADRLEILQKEFDKKDPEVIWTRRGTQGEIWKYEQVSFDNVFSSRIMIKGYFGDGTGGYIAIDDIEILLETCPPRKLCSFDDTENDANAFCEFDKGINDDFSWDLSPKPIPEGDEFPLDHTTQTRDGGHYVYINTNGYNKGQVARLISPTYPPMESACVKFWLYTTEFSEFYVHMGSTAGAAQFGYYEGRLTKEWNCAAVQFTPDTHWRVTFEGRASGHTKVELALDDIEISFNDSCTVIEFCDFEQNDCLWHNEASSDGVNDKVDWVRISHATRSESGPKIDHTNHLPTGYYLLAEPSYQNEAGETAVLVSNVLPTDYKCFSFWYHTAEKNGKIEVWYYSSSDFVNGKSLVTIPLDQPNSWLFAPVTLPAANYYGVNANFLIKIVAVFDKGNAAISIDDIRFEKTPCEDSQQQTFHCKTSDETILQLQVCDYIIDCKDKSDESNCGSCDFETGNCGYTDVSTQTYEWYWTRSAEASKRVPSAPLDHTFGNESGYYAWVNKVDDKDYTSTATLHSPLIQYASSTCHMTFWFYKPVIESEATDLKVSIITSHGHNTYEVYTTEDLPPQSWSKAIVYIGRLPQPFSVEFSAHMSTYVPRFVAVDDIKFTQCQWQNKTCSTGMFTCLSGNGCIDNNRVCDYAADCDDASDEIDCEKNLYLGCDFEEGMCFWDSSSAWMRTKSQYQVPYRDHTLGTSEGWYLRPNYRMYSDETQRLDGLVLLPSENCTMRFYYYLEAYNEARTTELKISTRHYTNGEEKVYFIRDRTAGQYFFREEITFNESKSFEILFDAFLSYYSDNLALDDISFDANCKLDKNPLPTGSQRDPDFCCEGQVQCKSALDAPCIKDYQVCDFNYDCPDKTDEDDCGACSFETGRCGWKDTSSGMFRWDLRQGKDFVSGVDNIPVEDHTNDDVNGWFLLLTKHSAGDSFATSSFLESPIYGATAPTCRLSFWYHSSGSAGTLKLSVQSHDRNTIKTIATLPDNEYQPWKEFSVVLGEMGAGYQLVFEAIVNDQEDSSTFVGMAIDDVTFSNCSVKESLSEITFHDLSCNFDKGLCEWHQEIVNDQIDWKIGSGSTPTNGTGPQADHTSGKGSYLYIEYDDDMGSQYNPTYALLVSPMMPPTDGLCLRFWSHMFGEDVSELQVMTVTPKGKSSTKIWTHTGSQGNLWRGDMASIISYEPYQVVISGLMGGGERSDIGLDDISLINGKCRQLKQMDCTFELGTCDWTNSTTDEAKWLLVRAYDILYFDGNDHTTDTDDGHVLQAHLSTAPRAELKSEVYQSGPNGGCFRYWLYVEAYGTDEQELYVNVSYPGKNYWSKEDAESVEREWEYRQTNIDANEYFQVTIVASFIGGYGPTVLLDDLSFLNSTCLPYGSCDFENDWCGWKHDVYYGLQWLRNSGSTKSDYTGPDKDHTRGSKGNDFGYYVFVDSSSGKAGDSAFLTSPTLASGRTVCFSFYYHMKGEETGRLSVNVRNKLHDSVEIFSVEGHDAVEWQPVFIEIHELLTNSWLVIEATLRGGTKGDIALDDLHVQPEECHETEFVQTTVMPPTTMPPNTVYPGQSTTPNKVTPLSPHTLHPVTIHTDAQTASSPLPTTTPVPPVRLWRPCGDPSGQKVSYFAWCDGIKDCPNGEDEPSNCHKCTDINEFFCDGNCFSTDKMCDGTNDCGNGIDERMCDVGCFGGFCANDVECTNEQVNNGTKLRPKCKCPSKYAGFRCQVSVAVPKVETASKGWIAGVVVLVVMIVVGIAFLVQRKCYPRRTSGDQRPIMMENPTYDFPTNIQLTDIPREPEEKPVIQLGTPPKDEKLDEEMVNPIYGESSNA